MEKQQIIHVFATWKVREGQIDKVLNLLKTVRAESIKETGNLFYKIHQSISEPNILVLAEGYTGEAAVAEHRNSSHYQELVIGEILPLLENREVVLTIPLD
ncbi:antibiotic biosynthesis monooxygenase [Flavobacterium zepuense]|uniref:Antibiotic biosynthesis monooxygenase n=1 Tax=Flavobacterium zepuense TaxID=2593302 RepID=A0A552V9K1_9FLAO|nr:antibiotic biosynthesis monooxygenase [Flavobacterium zepuense]TRW27146.1 antibiotic biosynthesis monooxygenase [Flavobacterium zepuense]